MLKSCSLLSLHDDSSDAFALSRVFASKSDIVRVLDRQVPVVLGVEQVQEFCRVRLNHHFRGIGLPGSHRVDHLVLRAEWHRRITTNKRICKAWAFNNLPKWRQIFEYLQLCIAFIIHVLANTTGCLLVEVLLHCHFVRAHPIIVLVTNILVRSLGWGSLAFIIDSIVYRVLRRLSVIVLTGHGSIAWGCFFEGSVGLVFIETQLVSDCWVRLDVWFVDNDMHLRSLEIIGLNRKSLFQFIKLLLSQRSFQFRLSRRLRHPHNLANWHILCRL